MGSYGLTDRSGIALSLLARGGRRVKGAERYAYPAPTYVSDVREPNLHEIVTERAQRLLLPRGLSSESRARVLQATSNMRDQPEHRAEYFRGMLGAWMLLQVGVILAMSIPVAIAEELDKSGLRAVVSVAAGLEAFCIGGALLACWWYYAARRAARAARRFGTSSPEYRQAAARATSSGRTVPYQALLGLVVTVLVLVS